MIKAVVFDFGDVLIHYHTEKFHREISKYLKLNYNSARPFIEKLLHRFEIGEINEEVFWRKLSEEFNVKLPDGYKRFIKVEFSTDAKPNMELIKIVRKLKNHYILAIISNINKPHAEVARRKNWFKYFGNLFLSCNLGARKPGMRIFKFALKKLKLKGSECIFIDNKKINLKPAEKLGMKVILFKNPKQLRKDLVKCGVNGI